MPNIVKPNSNRDKVQNKFPRCLCRCIGKGDYIVYDKPRGGVIIGRGTNAQSAWAAASGGL